jgi:hypothetical protein
MNFFVKKKITFYYFLLLLEMGFRRDNYFYKLME